MTCKPPIVRNLCGVLNPVSTIAVFFLSFYVLFYSMHSWWPSSKDYRYVGVYSRTRFLDYPRSLFQCLIPSGKKHLRNSFVFEICRHHLLLGSFPPTSRYLSGPKRQRRQRRDTLGTRLIHKARNRQILKRDICFCFPEDDFSERI